MPRARKGGKPQSGGGARGIPPGITDVTGTRAEPKMGRQASGQLAQWNQDNAGPLLVTVSGPLFDGRIHGMIDSMTEDMVTRVSDQAYADWMFGLNSHIQHPTPYYETQVTITRADPDLAIVHDRGVIYGPWLEGVSERNQATRFKGYHSARRAADELRRKLVSICQPIASYWEARFNGV